MSGNGWRLRKIDKRVATSDDERELQDAALAVFNAWGKQFVATSGKDRSAPMRHDRHARVVGKPENALLDRVHRAAFAYVVGVDCIVRPGESRPTAVPFDRESFDPQKMLAEIVAEAERWEAENGHGDDCRLCNAARGRAFA